MKYCAVPVGNTNLGIQLQSMRYLASAADYDGTLAAGGRVPETTKEESGTRTD